MAGLNTRHKSSVMRARVEKNISSECDVVSERYRTKLAIIIIETIVQYTCSIAIKIATVR